MTVAADMPAIRMHMPEAWSARIGAAIMDAPATVRDRLYDQLWLRTTLMEQMRRLQISERDAFAERADRVLEALDPVWPA